MALKASKPWKQWETLFWGAPKITSDGDCSHKIKIHLLLGRKAVTDIDSILKSRDITLPTKVHLVKTMVFPVVMYGCERWAIKRAECWRIDAFELWCWRRLLRIPWTERRSKQSILKEISPEYSLEGLILKLKLQYFGHLMQKTDSLEKPWCWERLKAGGEGDDRGWDGWMESRTWWTWVWVNSGSWWRTGKTGVLQSMGSQRVGHDWVTELKASNPSCLALSQAPPLATSCLSPSAPHGQTLPPMPPSSFPLHTYVPAIPLVHPY